MHHHKCSSCEKNFNVYQPKTCDGCIKELREKIKQLEKQLEIAEVACLETDET